MTESGFIALLLGLLNDAIGVHSICERPYYAPELFDASPVLI